MEVNAEILTTLIDRLKKIDSRYSERDADVLSEVAKELQRIISFLVEQKDGYKWSSIHTGIFHTKNHINNLKNKTMKWRIDGYKYGYEQTLDDLVEIRNILVRDGQTI